MLSNLISGDASAKEMNDCIISKSQMSTTFYGHVD